MAKYYVTYCSGKATGLLPTWETAEYYNNLRKNYYPDGEYTIEGISDDD